MRKFSALSSSLFAEAVSVLQKDVDKLEESMKMTENIDEKIEKLEKTMDLDQNSVEVREGNVENRVENLTNLITNMDGEEHPGEILSFQGFSNFRGSCFSVCQFYKFDYNFVAPKFFCIIHRITHFVHDFFSVFEL